MTVILKKVILERGFSINMFVFHSLTWSLTKSLLVVTVFILGLLFVQEVLFDIASYYIK